MTRKDTPDTEIAIVGGGINGITTANLLEIAGYNTVLYTERTPKRPVPYNKNPQKEVATYYPAASIPKKPHNLIGDAKKIEELHKNSWDFFKQLTIPASMGVRNQTHYETKIDGSGSIQRNEKLQEKTIDDLSVFKDTKEQRIMFTEPKIYFKKIYDLYSGRIIKERLSKEQILSLEEDIKINCTGYQSKFLFDDKSLKAMRGHLIYADSDIPRNNQGEIFSYNIDLPKDSIVYMYPRSDYTVLGGSKQIGTPDINGEWNGETSNETIKIGDEKIPRHIQAINEKLIENINNELENNKIKLTYKDATKGYRPWREDGPRIEIDPKYHNLIHNYGHGGAGVTLSWGSGFEVLKKIENLKEKSEKTDKEKKSELKNKLLKRISSNYN